MNKREREEHVLKTVEPLLGRLYGQFSLDKSQTDRPDAAILVDKPGEQLSREIDPFRVGIEITTVDKGEHLGYLNDEKHGRDKILAQTMDALEKGIDSDQPIKKAEIQVTESYIFDGAMSKKDKYYEYLKDGNYGEMILLCFSEIITTESPYFKEYLCERTNYLLSAANFPYDAVLFTSLRRGEPVIIYKKTAPLIVSPVSNRHAGLTETVVRGPTMRVGQTYNINEIMSNAPLITPRKPRRR
ncbi:hypothetical protein M4R23_07355 [Acidovorax sp. GBBC 3332]|nr:MULTISPECIES: hypothetical protein [unclassified Acidovorax]MDA8449226.1 hypothetical protein [Acidovorax sp. GBBC 3297]MDA8458686.1 hypothetical protein [Acidovorax sp. GBBC 3333]MDA8463982.1 hypothetical protein [Acidovorax sp. GBBC 3332]MDA8469014.1 hypothetical protein [Acidovorax sp. GBBC 3299]WCM80612.1 hypothetical protein M5C94_10160 [Acidovorax sp. GBBC 712]